MKPSLAASKKRRLSGKVAPKKKVMTLVERDGRARSFHIANIHANNLRDALVTNVDRASTLMTDDARVLLVNRSRVRFARHHASRSPRVCPSGGIH